MLRAIGRVVLLGAFVAGSIYSPSASASEKEDAAIATAVDKVLDVDVANANFGDAKKKLHGLLDRCKRGCSGPAVAHIYVALGLVSAQINQAEDARTAWTDAFSLDPNASLPSSGVPPSVRQQFEDVRSGVLGTNAPSDEIQRSGWINKQAYELARQGIAAEQAQRWPECIEKDKASLTLEENLRTRMHLAECETNLGKLVDALRDNAKALEGARAKNDTASAKLIQERVKSLLPRLAHVKFERPDGVLSLQILFDERPIPEARLSESFTIDPGAHTIHAEGMFRGARVTSDETFEVQEGASAQVKIKMKAVALTIGQLECMAAAKTPEETLLCVPADRKTLQGHAAIDVSGYTDSLDVHVLSPSVRGSISSPTAGWNIGANYLVDVVTAASPDVVATASRRFSDVRHAVGLTGGYKPGRFGAQVFGNYSRERDYISRTIGLTTTGDFINKQISPALGYSFTWDTIGRTGTSYDVFSHTLETHEITAGSTIVLTPLSLVVVGVGVALEQGDQSKPYRYIPLFAPGVTVPVGASIDEVNKSRLPTKPLEQLPLDRQRFSLNTRFVSRVTSHATLRIEERLYHDTWGINASTTDVRYMIDVSSRLRLWPHVHVHAQTGAEFYQRVYAATLRADGSATIPAFRSSDRELSPMLGFTGGGGFRYGLSDPSAKFQIALFTNADALFNDYANTLYIRTRLAGYGTIGIEADFE